MRKRLDISAYLVIGPENTRGRPVAPIIGDAVDAGFTCIQVRSKTASARELIELVRQASEAIARVDRSGAVTLLVDDRLDVVLAARKRGIKVDGVHVGRDDIPVDVCRRHLGDDSIIGLSARSHEFRDHLRAGDLDQVDYLGIGPLRETSTKPDCGQDGDGNIIALGFPEIAELARLSPVPVVVGGGVKLDDLPLLARTGADGFFVVSAVAEADDPKREATKLVQSWRAHRLRS